MSSTAVTSGRPAKAHHTPEEVKMALQTLAVENGSAYRASRELKEQGINVGKATLARWRDGSHSEEYLEIRDQLQGAEQRRLAARHEDLSRKGADVTEALWQRLETEVEALPSRDVPGALRNAATALGISTDKILTTRERPVVMPPEHRTGEQILAQLEAMGAVKQIEPPVVDAEVVEEDK
jgi:hypothetical protein